MTSQGISTCAHCGHRIVLVNFAMGPEWVHQPQGSSFMDNAKRFCEITSATPAQNPWPVCTDHKEVQHRDRKAPWCDACGWHRGASATSPVRLGNPNRVRVQDWSEEEMGG